MTDAQLNLKIQALLHDPPDKAGVLFGGTSHVKIAKSYLSILLEDAHARIPGAVKTADHIASGADRYNLPAWDKELHLDWAQHPVLIHPLSGAQKALTPLTDISKTQEIVALAVERIRSAYPDNQPDHLERRYLSVWRELPELVHEEDQGQVFGPAWEWLPAETRIPDHSIWSHLRTASALAGAGIGEGETGSAALLLFTLGPVQAFIAAARTTRDLWAGSYLLSYLSWQAMRVVCEECGPDAILFPDLYQQPLVDRWLREEKGLTLIDTVPNANAATLPNRFFAVVPDRRAEELARRAEEAVQTALAEIGEFARGKIGGDEEMWRQQLAHFLECYWTVLPLKRFKQDAADANFADAFRRTYPGFWGDNDKFADADADRIINAFAEYTGNTNVGAVYGRLFRLTDRLLGGRKALRDFRQLPEPGYRCTLIPELAAIAPRSSARPKEMRKFWEDAARKTGFQLRKGEQLSAVSAAKRFFPEYLKKHAPSLAEGIDARFPSTSSFAAADYKADFIGALQNGNAPELRQALTTFRDALKAVGGDEWAEAALPRLEEQAHDELTRWLARLNGEWLFAESYEPERIEREYGEAAKETLEQARDALSTLLRASADARIEPPSKYYAVLMLDGDHMGQWLSGARAPLFHEALHPMTVTTMEAKVENGEYVEWGALLDREKQIRRPLAPAYHLSISRALGNFSLHLVRRIVEQRHLGRVIYSGGDDVLALVSFRDALAVARALRAAFSGQLDEQGEVNWHQQSGFVDDGGVVRLSMGHKATASAGVVFAHHVQPLQQVLAQARQAEKAAKKAGRNRLALAAMKHSGEIAQAVTPWYVGEAAEVDMVEALNRFAALLRRGWLASGFIYNLEELRTAVCGAADSGIELDDGQRVMLRAEARRLFLRHAQAIRCPDNEPECLRQCPEWMPSGIEPGSGALAAQLRSAAFEHTAGQVIDALGFSRAVKLLDVAQFIGKGGAR